MNNPWKDINLSDYESHMALDSVWQLQAMNQMMKGQLNKYDIQSAIISSLPLCLFFSRSPKGL